MSVHSDPATDGPRDGSTLADHRPFILCIVDQIGGLSNGAAIRQHHLVRAVGRARRHRPFSSSIPAARGHESELAAALGAQVAVATRAGGPEGEGARRMLRHPSLPWRLARSDTERLADVVASLIARDREPDLLWVSSLAGWRALPRSSTPAQFSISSIVPRPPRRAATHCRSPLACGRSTQRRSARRFTCRRPV